MSEVLELEPVIEPAKKIGHLTVNKGHEVIVLKNDKFSFYDNEILTNCKTKDTYAHKTLHHDQYFQVYKRTDRTVRLELERSKTYSGPSTTMIVEAPIFEFDSIQQRFSGEHPRDMS